MNNKGFTIVEVVIAFAMLAAILLSLITFSITYRDKVRNEEIKTQLIDYKNTITKIIYDDIIRKKITSIEKCDGQDDSNITCVEFINADNEKISLEIMPIFTTTSSLKKGIYLKYHGINYMLPDSDLNKTDEAKSQFIDNMCSFEGGFNLTNYNDIYSLKLTYRHYILEEVFDINLVVN